MYRKPVIEIHMFEFKVFGFYRRPVFMFASMNSIEIQNEKPNNISK